MVEYRDKSHLMSKYSTGQFLNVKPSEEWDKKKDKTVKYKKRKNKNNDEKRREEFVAILDKFI